jgi:deoxyxylulose-5-phosphate synthase
VLGVPRSYIAQGPPDEILSNLGLDGAGIAASVREVLHRSAPRAPKPGATTA